MRVGVVAVVASGCLTTPQPTTSPGGDANIVFVTSTVLPPAQFGGLDGADAICNARAHDAGLAGTYVAWLSTATTDAKTRLGTARGWVLTDGRPFAATLTDLLGGRIYNPPMLDERRSALGATEFIATAADDDGTRVTDAGNVVLSCADWTMDDGRGTAGGIAIGTTGQWTYSTTSSCTAAAHLYCFGIDHQTDVAPPPISPMTRLAFVSVTEFTPGGGLAAANALCNADGAVTGHGPFDALLATSGRSARSLFSVSGRPFYRTDGVLLTSDLVTFEAPLDVTAGGAYIDDTVYLGAEDLADSQSAATCGDWMDPSAAGTLQVASLIVPDSVGHALEACQVAHRVFCLEE